MAKKKGKGNRQKRGYPLAILIGLEDMKAVFWKVFSEVVKPDITIKRGRKRVNQDPKQLYSFHELIVDALRPIVRAGNKSFVLINPPKTKHGQELMEHIKKHHDWLIKDGRDSISFGIIEGSAENIGRVSYLVQQDEFKEVLGVTTNDESEKIMNTFESRILSIKDKSEVFYTLKEIEGFIGVSKKKKSAKIQPVIKVEYIILTDRFLDEHQQKQRIHRLLQIASNKSIKTKIIDAESDAGIRVDKFGGLICFTETI